MVSDNMLIRHGTSCTGTPRSQTAMRSPSMPPSAWSPARDCEQPATEARGEEGAERVSGVIGVDNQMA